MPSVFSHQTINSCTIKELQINKKRNGKKRKMFLKHLPIPSLQWRADGFYNLNINCHHVLIKIYK